MSHTEPTEDPDEIEVQRHFMGQATENNNAKEFISHGAHRGTEKERLILVRQKPLRYFTL
jgi:hypothetical protein